MPGAKGTFAAWRFARPGREPAWRNSFSTQRWRTCAPAAARASHSTPRSRCAARSDSTSGMDSVLPVSSATSSGCRSSNTPERWTSGAQPMDILDAIGNTSLVRLRKVVPPNCADIFAKLESENPTGSMKDRMAQAVISRAEQDGRLKPGDTVVEYTGGSTGTSLAFVCAVKSYRLRVVTSDAFSQEKLDHMAALGAELTLLPSEGGRTTKKLILDMIEAARALSREPRTFWSDQLNNRDAIAGYYSLAEEIWTQTKGEIHA